MASTYDPHFRAPSTTWVPEYPRLDPFYPYQEWEPAKPIVGGVPSQLDVRDEWLLFVNFMERACGVTLEYCAGCGRHCKDRPNHAGDCPLRPMPTGAGGLPFDYHRAMRADDV